jgi:hypothetical protein
MDSFIIVVRCIFFELAQRVATIRGQLATIWGTASIGMNTLPKYIESSNLFFLLKFRHNAD